MFAQHRLGSSFGTCGTTAAACQRHSLITVPVCRTPHQIFQRLRLGVLRATAAAAEGADAEQQQEQQQQQKQQSQQQQSKDKDSQQNFTKARAKKLARVVQDSSTPNTGIVSLTAKSSVSGAAACVAADFKTNRLTRIVPCTEDQTQRAAATLKLANTMVNADLASQAADQGRNYVKQTLVFQPVEVMGDMAAPPAFPVGANALYACCLPIDDPTLQAALTARSAALAAGDYYPSSGGSSSSSSGNPLRALTVNSGSNHIKLADILSYRLSTDGWVELATQGRPDYALPVAVQALVKLRRVRYGRHKEDATVLLLGDEDVLGSNGRSLPPAQQGMFPPVSFLIVRCAKNYSTKLLPLPTKSEAAASDS